MVPMCLEWAATLTREAKRSAGRMAPLPDSTSPEHSPARLPPRKRRRVASYSAQAVGDAALSSCESAEMFSGGSDDEWAPDDDASSGGGGSDSEDGAAVNDSDDGVGEDCKEGIRTDEGPQLEQQRGDVQILSAETQALTMVHTPELFCTVCEREFSFKHALVRHLKRRHKSDERPFECAVCRLAFRSKRELNAHANDHKGAAHGWNAGLSLSLSGANADACASVMWTEVEGVRHKCKGCGRSFATRHERRQHFRKTHFFTCPFRTCGDRFAEQLAWTKHIRRYHKGVSAIIKRTITDAVTDLAHTPPLLLQRSRA